MRWGKVVGGVRFISASFHEVEAFAKLGSDRDKTTQAQLDSGYRMVELLKQPQYQALDVVDQVISIYAGSGGYFAAVPVKKVAETEQELLAFMRDEKSEVRDKLMESGALDEETEPALIAALDEFVARLEKTQEPAAV